MFGIYTETSGRRLIGPKFSMLYINNPVTTTCLQRYFVTNQVTAIGVCDHSCLTSTAMNCGALRNEDCDGNSSEEHIRVGMHVIQPPCQ